MMHHGDENEVVCLEIGHQRLEHVVIEAGATIGLGNDEGENRDILQGIEAGKELRLMDDNLEGLLLNTVVAHIQQPNHIARSIHSLHTHRPIEMEMRHPILHLQGVKTILSHHPLHREWGIGRCHPLQCIIY